MARVELTRVADEVLSAMPDDVHEEVLALIDSVAHAPNVRPGWTAFGASSWVTYFGITKGSDAQHDLTTTGVVIGTPACMAPKRCRAPSTTAPTCTRSAACSSRRSPAAGPSPARPGT